MAGNLKTMTSRLWAIGNEKKLKILKIVVAIYSKIFGNNVERVNKYFDEKNKSQKVFLL